MAWGMCLSHSVFPLLFRQTMIVTTEYCELLCVEAEHMRRIYEVTLRYSVSQSTCVLHSVVHGNAINQCRVVQFHTLLIVYTA